jgi:signal transduction histidine kinase/CheY-like chemotaxis protein
VTVETRDAQLAALADAVDNVALAMERAIEKGDPPEESPLLGDLPDGVFVASIAGDLLAANAALHALFAAPPGALLGTDVFETFNVPRPEPEAEFAEALGAAEAIERADGSALPVVVSARLTGEGDGRRLIGVAREAAAAPEPTAQVDPGALAAAEARADAASKAKEEFLSVMSHELRTPLNGVLGGAAVLAGTQLDESQRGFLSLVENSGKRMLSLVTDLLDYRRIAGDDARPNGPAPIDMEQLAQEIAASVADKAAKKDLDIYVRVQPGMPPMFADAEALVEIGEQLADNAVKFTEHGHVGVEIGQRRAEDGGVELTLTVTDTGKGVPEAEREGIFDVFTVGDGSVNRTTDGVGLGLSIVRKLADRLGATVTVSDGAAGGAAFSVSLRPETDRNARPPAPAADMTGVRALVVDPVEGARGAVRDHLAYAGAEVTEAASALDAAAALDGGDYDMVVHSAAAVSGVGGDALLARISGAKQPVATLALGADAALDALEGLPEGARTAPPNAPSSELLRAAEAALVAAGRRAKEDAGATPAAGDRPALEVVDGGRRQTRILLGDSNPVTRVVLESYLKKAGFDVASVDDGVKAVNVFKSHTPNLVLLDVAMPVMSGIEAVKAIRRHEKSIGAETPAPVIGLIGVVREGERERCAHAGISDFLSKPVRTEALEAKLERWLVLHKTAGGAAAVG